MDNSNNSNPHLKPVLIAKDWLIVAILTIIMTVAWIASSVYQTLVRSTVPELVKAQTLPFQPQLDEKIIDELQNRTSFQNETLNESDRVIFKNLETVAP